MPKDLPMNGLRRNDDAMKTTAGTIKKRWLYRSATQRPTDQRSGAWSIKKHRIQTTIFNGRKIYFMTREEKFMLEAIRLSHHGILKNEGGPFGCVIVKDNEIVGRGNNRVTSSNDPTAHAEVVAIRDACQNLGTFQLDGCEIYTSCEPCPMCLGAIYWARPKVVYYANNRQDAANIGFDDSLIYEEMICEMDKRKIPIISLGREEALKIFEEWEKKQDRTNY